MCSTNQNFKCCSADNVFEATGNQNQRYPQVVNKQLPPKVLEPIVQNKIVEVPKEVYLEKIIEVPQIKTVERIVEQIKPVIKYKNVYKPKTVYVEKIKNVDKIIYQEKIVEVPQIKTVEKVVEVPVYVDRERIIKVPKYMVVERVIPILKTTKEERVMEVQEVNCPNIDVNKKVESKERIEVKDLKENETTKVVDDKEIQILNELSNSNVNLGQTINVETTQEQTMKVATQENFCTTLGCKFFPIYPNCSKIAPPLFRSYQDRERQLMVNSNIYRSKQIGFPRIRIAKTPHTNQRSCYCNCS